MLPGPYAPIILYGRGPCGGVKVEEKWGWEGWRKVAEELYGKWSYQTQEIRRGVNDGVRPPSSVIHFIWFDSQICRSLKEPNVFTPG